MLSVDRNKNMVLGWGHTLSGDEGAPEKGSESTEPHVGQLLFAISNMGVMRCKEKMRREILRGIPTRYIYTRAKAPAKSPCHPRSEMARSKWRIFIRSSSLGSRATVRRSVSRPCRPLVEQKKQQ